MYRVCPCNGPQIVDPGIYVRDAEYSTFSRGLEQNVFVMDMENVNPYLGQVMWGAVCCIYIYVCVCRISPSAE